ncbi:hypothetical protein D3C80_991370 [compost metagenome]
MLAVALPDRQGKHTVQARQQVGAPGVITLEQHFGITVRIEGITEAFQLAAQLGEVIDGTVEGQRQAQRIIDHGLGRAVGQVHDFQSAMAEGNRPLAIKAPGVGAARCQVMGDPLDCGEVRRAWWVGNRGETKLSS